MNKPQEILDLEEVYKFTLEQTKNKGDIINWRKSNLYLLNDKQQVIGLNISRNKILEIKNLDHLIHLKQLDISKNHISKIENLDHLKELNQLNISDNKISKIENLDKLIKLSVLEISSNQISKIEQLDKLDNLYTLDISSNQISKIENLDKLNNLYTLDISNNKVSRIQNLEKLIKLSKLIAHSNKLFKIENLGNLKNLYILDFSANKIAKIENLENLSKLSRFYISYNQLREVNHLKHLKQLEVFYASYNKISSIESLKNIFFSRKIGYLRIHKNPFVEKNSLVLDRKENHLDIIKSELKKLKEKQIAVQLPVKVMLLGNHASGKSTFLKYLQTQKCSKVNTSLNTSTHVLSVEDSEELINYKLPKAIFYDFGGQDYYHGVYQAFFTQETLNLLVWTPESDSNTLLEKDSNTYSTRNYNRSYWLAQLQYSFLKRFDSLENYDDPLLLIQTHADKYTTKRNWNGVFEISNIVDEFHVSFDINFESLKNKASLNYLSATFWDTVSQQADEKEVPEWYPEFLSYIINKKNPDAISLKTIASYYKRDGLSNEEKRQFLKEDLEQLARKGLLLYYKNDEELNDVAWLNPSGTVSDIHGKILNINKVKAKGRLTQKAFQEENIDPKIERLLLNEKVLFFDDSSKEYIIPNYLPLTSEDDEIYDLLKFDFNKPTFVLKFERFIPFGLINQLICHYGQNPDKKHYWRNQLIFTLHEKFKIWIQLDFSRLTISVSIKSQIPKDYGLNSYTYMVFIDLITLYWGTDTSEIKEMLDSPYHANSETQKLILENNLIHYKALLQKINKPEDLYISTDGEYFVHYNTLNDSDKTHESIVSYQLPEDENNLDKNNPRTQRSSRYRNFTDNENIKKMKKIFISYSRKDVAYKDELRKHLNMLKLFDVADNWSCEDITIGKWHDQIQKELEESDLVIFMLSINFFNSKYILEQEVQKTMDDIAKGSGKKVYCIVVSDFPGLNLFNEDDLTEEQKSILKLGSYQYGMYTKIENRITGNEEEKIISLKEASNKGIIDTQLTKIVTKIMKDIN